jgi:signal transduction histidine kinase
VARKMVQHCRIEARRVISDLRQQGCDLTSLSQSVAAALREITEHHGVDVFLDVKGSALQLPVDVAQNVLRICQEAATNAVRHGSPSHIAVRLEFGDRLLAVSVEDDGTGFHPGQVPAGRFGLAIMEERVRRFNGELRVESDPGRGTRIVAAIPLPRKRK